MLDLRRPQRRDALRRDPAGRFFWASDFPHPDHPPHYVPEVARIVRELSEDARAGFLGRNVFEAFGLGGRTRQAR